MNYNILLLTIIAFMAIMAVNRNTKNVSSSSQYMLNTYLYLFVGTLIVLITASCTTNDYGLQQYIMSRNGAIMNMVLMFMCLFVVMSISDDDSVIKHLAWVVFMICLGLFMYMNFVFVKSDTTRNAAITTLVLFISLSWFAYRLNTQVMSQRYNLLFLLLCLIAFQMFYFIMSQNKNQLRSRQKMTAVFTIALFSGFMIYDTQYIKSKQSMDYASDSMSLGIDILNLFIGASVLYN